MVTLQGEKKRWNGSKDHYPPLNLLKGKGAQSGAHVDIMQVFALIEFITFEHV
ncbi:phospholipid:diacylglycerol acyltransferase, putative [Medicago truncatula]|uniref:Phospholipid:diacylglycerol acyltransferase, putative n=1 Tax=Medicago truncatula TaxID=3880 RepID=G7LAI3_MEDTR|nr:phospholipid:diacylglycerol acyltransferase, putative [Medicago truncatula]